MSAGGRPPLPIGSHGVINVTQEAPKRWVARCRYRDADGETRPVSRTGASKSAATNALRAALAERRHNAGAMLTPDSRLSDAAAMWLARREAEAAAGDLAATTLDQYRSALKLHVLPTLGGLRLREMSVARCEAWQVALRARRGPSSTKTARTVLSGILGYAARMGAIPTNPCRDLSLIPGGRKRVVRALTAQERADWLDKMEGSAIAKRWDIPDLTRFMLATGCRVGEALAVSWDEVDFDASTVRIAWHLTRAKGDGLNRVVGTKRGEGRLLMVPSWCTAMLLGRRVASPGAWPVFPDSLGGWRDPSNTMRVLRGERDAAGFGWVTTHVFRKTTMTILDEAKLTPRQIADVAGHADPGMTQRVYMARGVASPESADALEGLL